MKTNGFWNRLGVLVMVAGLGLIGCAMDAGGAGPGLTADQLRCEYMANPQGLDLVQPRLSWQVQSGQRGQNQTAYQILVASRPELLAQDKGDRWDSGKVTTDQTIHITYDGKPLASFDLCCWKVRVWDRDGQPSAWSPVATWSMGVLKPKEWRGKWIGYTPAEGQTDVKTPELAYHGGQWIWFPQADPQWKAKAGTAYFRKVVSIPADQTVSWAGLLFTGSDTYKVSINGQPATKQPDKGHPWDGWRERKDKGTVEVTGLVKPGRNVIAVEAVTRGGSAGITGKLLVILGNGKEVAVQTDGSWRSSESAGEGWTGVGFDDKPWQPAKVLGEVSIGPWGMLMANEQPALRQRVAAPLLRKEFTVKKGLVRATAAICGLGYHELYLNGAKVGDEVLQPAFTRYDIRSLYVTHDVTGQLKPGANAVGIMLGNGWLNVHTRAAWDFYQAPWRARPMALLQMRLDYDDGASEVVVTDGSWKGKSGPITHDQIREGEHYDARLERTGWDQPGYDASGWQPVQLVAAPAGVLSAQVMPGMRVTETIKPVKLTEPKPGMFVFDLGQNIPGWVRLQATGPAGARIQMRYAERINADGTINQERIAEHSGEKEFQTDAYTMKGEGVEQWEPRFVYHGFQYVEVTGYPGTPTLESITGRVVHTGFDSAGQFECSNELINAIQRLTLWSYRGNYHGYPTDCPHREKNGWTGDAHLAAEQAQFNFQNSAAYTKWMQDISDEMRTTGELPGIVPTPGWGYKWGNGPAWDSAYLIIPWYLYQYQGDIRILADNYDKMKRYVDYLTRRANNGIVSIGLGDWAPVKTQTPTEETSTGYYFVDVCIVAQTAKLLGHEADAKTYSQLADSIAKSFNDALYKGDGRYANGSQTAQSCALYQGFVAPELMEQVTARLVEAVQKANSHIDTGILGAKYLFNALADQGRADVAWKIATQTTYPSYGDWVARGATTLWEDFKGGNSLNHIMFGDISGWFYKYLAGIQVDPQQPGFKHAIIRPQLVEGLTWVRANHESLRGRFASAWKLENGSLTLTVTVPANCTATVYVPVRQGQPVLESGQPAASAPGVKPGQPAKGVAVFEIQSGEYVFRTAH